MNRMQLRFKLLLIIVFAAFFQSCEKDEDSSIVYGDVIIQSFNRGDSIVYGLCYYAYSFDQMKEVTVLKEGSTSEVALDSAKYRYTYSLIPDTSEYTSLKPSRSNYTFNATFDDGTEYQASDLLDSIAIKPPVIKEYQFDAEDVKFNIDWDAVAHAEQYMVVLENDSAKIVFKSDLLNYSQTYLLITTSSTGWATNNQPKGGEIYRATVVAYQYEPTPTTFDMQSISFTQGAFFQWLKTNR